MKCPLLAFAWGNEGGKEPLVYPDCIKEECAWWQKELQNCIIYQLGMEIGTITMFIEDMANKIPHEEQFRK